MVGTNDRHLDSIVVLMLCQCCSLKFRAHNSESKGYKCHLPLKGLAVCMPSCWVQLVWVFVFWDKS
jgi:hypothetical protein